MKGFYTDFGEMRPDLHAYVDGYGFGDRLLEGVRFKVEVAHGTLACNGVHPDDAFYMEKFSDKQKLAWYGSAVEELTENDGDAELEDGTNVHWGSE